VAVTAQHLYEQTLIVRSQLGDATAFRELMGLHSPRLLGFVRRMMLSSSSEGAEDLSQEIWIEIYRGLPSLLDIRKFHAWAFRIARDRVYRQFRRRKLPIESLHEIAEEELPDAGDASSGIDVEQLQHCLGLLSLGHREVLMLRFFEEMDYEEIARVTRSTLGTVRSRLHYAKRALRRAIEQTAANTL
jgi:RNA polymerase sigma-70 factor (ECF subfamily)